MQTIKTGDMQQGERRILEIKNEVPWVKFLPWLLLIIGIYSFPLSLIERGFSHIPGDMGDSRFNMYVLEHGFKFMSGEVKEYWNAPFLYPYTHTIALSDNLLGTLPVYGLFRMLHCDRELAFQFWFISLFVLNFIFCYLALKKWTSHTILSSVGAYIFAFSIIVLGNINHIQTFPRFITPFVIYWFWMYLSTKENRYFMFTMLGLTFQFYCAMYLGFFLSFILLFFVLAYLFVYKDFALFTQFRNVRKIGSHLLMLLLTVVLLYPLIQPYVEISRQFGYREFAEVFSYLPTWRSYFSSTPEPVLWNFLTWHIRPTMNNWWEQFLFPGALPWLAITFFPFVLLSKKVCSNNKKLVALSILVLFLTIIFSMRMNNFTLYKVFFSLPGFGSMRSINRLINLEIFLFVLILVFVGKALIESYKNFQYFLLFLPLLVIADNAVDYWERRILKTDVHSRISFVRDNIQIQRNPNYKTIYYRAKAENENLVYSDDSVPVFR